MFVDMRVVVFHDNRVKPHKTADPDVSGFLFRIVDQLDVLVLLGLSWAHPVVLAGFIWGPALRTTREVKCAVPVCLAKQLATLAYCQAS